MKPNNKRRVGQVGTLGGVVSELGRVYRMMARSELDSLEGVRQAQVLGILRQALEIRDVESRIRALEDEKTQRSGR